MIRAVPREDATYAYLSGLLARAHAKRLATRTEWLRLGHWKRTLAGRLESQADGPNFFLSDRGKTSPGSELDATLRAFFATLPDGAGKSKTIQHPICQFPARFKWLDAELHFDPARLPHPTCKRYQDFLARVDTDRVSFVFSSYYLNNPASVFGHTFVRLIKRGKHDEERRELLDHAIEFSATVDTGNALIYSIKGLLGAFPGTFRNVPYHFKVRQYNDFESRDLYEYELALTRAELDLFLAHLWELGSTFFDYFYVSENCSYHLLGALEVIRPDLELLEHMHWPVIPADTIKALYANPGFVREVRFRPSLRRQFSTRLARIPDPDRDLLEQLMSDPTTPLPPDLPKPRAIDVLDAAQDLIDIRFSKQLLTKRDTWAARTKQTLLERRAALAAPSPPLSVRTPWRSMPQLGHHSRRFGLGYALDDARTHAVAIDFRLALHDLADPAPGYPEFSQLEFLPTRLRVNLEDGDVELDAASLVRVISLTPQDRFDRKLSWKIDAGALRLEDPGCPDGCYVARLAGGTGTTLATRGAGVIAFGTLDAQLMSGPHLQGIEDLPIRAGIGPSVGLRLRLATRLISLTTGELLWLPVQDPGATWRARSVLRFGVGRRLAFDLEAALDGTFDTMIARGQFLTMLYF